MPDLGHLLPAMKNARLMRVGLLAKYLSEHGHKVTWWSSSFDHNTKSRYCNEYREVQVNPNERIMMLHSPTAYKRNISPLRMLYSRNMGRELFTHAQCQEKPDIILCCLPLPEFAHAAVKYGRKHNVPVIIDVRDLWPDIYYRAVPRFLQPLAKAVIHFMKKNVGRTLAKAQAITGVSPLCVEWGCKLAKRAVTPNDRVNFISDEVHALSDDENSRFLKWWAELGVTPDTWNICFFGSLSIHSGVDTVIEAVKRLSSGHKDIRLIVGGAGDREQDFRELAKGYSSIVIPGFLNQKQMNSVMNISKCGVYCFHDSKQFAYMFGNKIIQYFSCGLPVINSLTGYSRTLLAEEHCGLTYTDGDVEDCMSKILYLYEHEQERKIMAGNSRSVFARMFEAAKVNQQFEAYFYDIIDNYNDNKETS